MNHLSVQLNNVGKAYRHYPTHWSRLKEWINPSRKRHTLHWILKGLNLDVPQGQSIGIIGRNGAGKSTLLKMITGTTKPTEGSLHVNGRVAALLELGMGFHGDFTGRQNIQLSSQLMGLADHELVEAMPAIEEFAEIGRYIDEPLRTYSSGMQMRLAFSLATAIRPDLLIVDEALAVGDIAFQHKCYARLRKYREAGTTLLFVSHDPGAVKSLCERAVLLHKGKIIADSMPDNVLDVYNAMIAHQENQEANANDLIKALTLDSTGGVRSGDQRATVLAVEIENEHGIAKVLRVGESFRIRIDVVKQTMISDLTIGFMVRDRLGNEVFGTNTWHIPLPSIANCLPGQRFAVTWNIPSPNIGPGSYSVSIALHSDMTHLNDNYDWWDNACHFEVVRGDQPLFEGVCFWPNVEPSIELIGPTDLSP